MRLIEKLQIVANNYSLANSKRKQKQLFTPKSMEYIKWRYLNNPLQNYIVIFNKDYFIAGYIKRSEWI